MSSRTSAIQGNIASHRQMRNPWVRENLSLIQHQQADDLKEICKLQGLVRDGHKRELARRVITRIEGLWTNGDQNNYGRIRAMILHHAPSNSLPQPNATIIPVGYAPGPTVPRQTSMVAPVAGLAAAIQQVGLSDNSNPSPHSSPPTLVEVGVAGVLYPSHQVDLSNSNRARRAVYIDAATNTDDLDVPRNLKWWDRIPQNPPRHILPYHKFLKNIKEVKGRDIDA